MAKKKNVEIGKVPLRVTDKMYLQQDAASGKIGKDNFTVTNPLGGSVMVEFEGRHYIVEVEDVIRVAHDHLLETRRELKKSKPKSAKKSEKKKCVMAHCGHKFHGYRTGKGLRTMGRECRIVSCNCQGMRKIGSKF